MAIEQTYDCFDNATHSGYTLFMCEGVIDGNGSIYVWLCIGIVIFGLVGNSLCTRILAKVQRIRDGVRILRYLTIADLMILILLPLPDMATLLLRDAAYANNIALTLIVELTTFVLLPAGHTVYTFEVYLTVLIALQRCLALTFPLRFKQMLPDSLINKLLIGIGVFSVTFNIPYWIYFSPHPVWYSSLNMTLIESFNHEFTKSTGFNIYLDKILPIFRCGIPMVSLMICNVVLIVSRRRMAATGQSTDRMGANQLTAIVIAITVMSSVVHILWACSYTIVLTPQTYELFFYLVCFRNLMFYVNCSTNFIFYCSFGKEFRRSLVSMFRRKTPSVPEIQLADIE